ncbi:MAG: acyloxyacyl hydrolase, partial [Desulfotignum sp.]
PKGAPMVLWKYIWAAALVVLFTASASAATVSGRSSTMLEWYDDPDGNGALPAYQYLLLNARNIKDTDVTFRFFGRLGTDLNDNVDVDNRLYYAYAEKRGINDRFDIKLGYMHYSNADIKSPNDGIDIWMGTVAWRF